jgi:hypothetical protein
MPVFVPSVAWAAVAAAVGALLATSPDRSQQDKSWREVLDLGKRQGADVRQRLRAIAQESSSTWAGKLAARMISLWDDSRGTFISEHPQPLFGSCFTPAEIESQLGDMSPGTIEIEVVVDISGFVRSAKIVRAQALGAAESVAREAMAQRRFLPAKPGSTYVESTLTMNCHLDPR